MYVSIPDCFMFAFLAGLIFGLVYEGLRIVRIVLPARIVVFLCDVAFFIASAFAVCKLSEFLGNYIRLYTVIGFAAGVFAYIATFGRLFNRPENAIARFIRKTAGKIAKKIGGVSKKFLGEFAQKSRAGFGKIHEYYGKFAETHLKPLHSGKKKMYNIKGNNNIGERENNVIKVQIRKSS